MGFCDDDDEVLSDLTDEEIINKYKNEKDEEMKVYCNKFFQGKIKIFLFLYS